MGYDGGYWQSTGIGRFVTARGLLLAMKARGCTVLTHGATGRGNDQVRFERYCNVIDPNFKVYAPWRDPALLNEFPGRTQMLEYLKQHGIGHQIVSQVKKRYSTDANVCGLSNEAEDLESMETGMTIVNPVMGVWPKDAPNVAEEVTLRFEKRILGTKSRGVYEAPGMTLLSQGLNYVYQAVLDRRSTNLFKQLSRHVSDQIYDGRYFDPSTRAAISAIWQLAEPANGTVKIEMYKGNMHFLSLLDCPHSVYFEADSSMEASEGLNPVSSQGFLEVSAVEAKSMAKAGLIDSGSAWQKRHSRL